jgi:hypothetical protein
LYNYLANGKDDRRQIPLSNSPGGPALAASMVCQKWRHPGLATWGNAVRLRQSGIFILLAEHINQRIIPEKSAILTGAAFKARA